MPIDRTHQLEELKQEFRSQYQLLWKPPYGPPPPQGLINSRGIVVGEIDEAAVDWAVMTIGLMDDHFRRWTGKELQDARVEAGMSLLELANKMERSVLRLAMAETKVDPWTFLDWPEDMITTVGSDLVKDDLYIGAAHGVLHRFHTMENKRKILEEQTPRRLVSPIIPYSPSAFPSDLAAL